MLTHPQPGPQAGCEPPSIAHTFCLRAFPAWAPRVTLLVSPSVSEAPLIRCVFPIMYPGSIPLLPFHHCHTFINSVLHLCVEHLTSVSPTRLSAPGGQESHSLYSPLSIQKIVPLGAWQAVRGLCLFLEKGKSLAPYFYVGEPKFRGTHRSSTVPRVRPGMLTPMSYLRPQWA